MLIYQATTKTAQEIVDETEILVKDDSNNIWTEAEVFQALKMAIRKLYPDVFTPKRDTSLTTSSNSYEYTIPDTLDMIHAVEILPSANEQYEGVRFHSEWDGSNNKLRLFELFASGLTIKLVGGTRLTIPDAIGDSLDIPVDAEDLLITGTKIELYEMILLDKGKMNQFAAREEEVTEVDVQNMIDAMKREYARRKGEIATTLISQVTRI
ncbi:MAG TPA: hypothetical protein ENH35_02930 [Candidatus Moranbacteria bacterium]|nr:hypothetical protein [Candidatus Pacearchaeota archaeon]HDZ85472.1 hypothetical protein [Candidatus Moranbacteria bacterium]